MTDITDNLEQLIQSEEVENGAGVSTGTFNKIGGITNAIANRTNNCLYFKFNGAFKSLFGGEDGANGSIWPYEIVGVSGYIRQTGTSGSTVLDIHSITGTTDNGTILSTPLTITSAAGDGLFFYKNLLDASETSATGLTLPVFTATDIAQGTGLRVDLDSNASDAKDVYFYIHWKPRTT